MLQAERLSISFGGPTGPRVLDRIDLSLEPHECVAVLGQPGSGKSTLLNVLGGLMRSDSGEVRIDGIALRDLSDAELTRLRRHRIGFLFQAFHLLPHWTASLNIALPLQLDGMTRKESIERAHELLEHLNLSQFKDALPIELSTEQIQSIALARALAHRPAVVLIDGWHTPNSSEQTKTLIDLLKSELHGFDGSAVIMTRDPEVSRHVDRTLELINGQLVPRK